jgi:pimeloyl-ACP methyl ester carboxylesterase
MFNFYLSFQWIYWTRPSGPVPNPPEGVERHWIKTPSGNLEILSCRPLTPSSKTPIYFVHGGMGGAWVWAEYMQYLAQRGVPSYAVSMRGHGNSWHPSYIQMVYFTTKSMLASDVMSGLRWVQEREGKEVVLAGHSSGGGLSQYILSEKMARVKGLALLGAVPGFGS